MLISGLKSKGGGGAECQNSDLTNFHAISDHFPQKNCGQNCFDPPEESFYVNLFSLSLSLSTTALQCSEVAEIKSLTYSLTD